MKLPEKPKNGTPQEMNTYYRKLTEYSEFQRAKNEQYYEDRIDKLNTSIAITLAALAVVCGVVAYMYLNR